MHSLIFINKYAYLESVKNILADVSNNYEKACYISFNESHHIVIEIINRSKAYSEKFIVLDASKEIGGIKPINKNTYVLNLDSVFNVYLFLRNLIQEERINLILLDSISALIDNHPHLPLKSMLTNLLLDIGTFKCDSLVLASNEHTDHEVIKHLEPFMSKNISYRTL